MGYRISSAGVHIRLLAIVSLCSADVYVIVIPPI
jgi:hypothetical protein